MGVGPSGRAGPGTGPRTAAASGTRDGQSESSISKKGLALAPFPRQRDCPQCPLPGLRGSITLPRLPAPGKGSQTHPSGTYTEPFPKAVCPQGLSNMRPHPGDLAQGCPQSHLCCSVGHRPRAALAEVLQALPGHGKDLLWGEQVGAAEGRDGTHGPLWGKGGVAEPGRPPDTPQPSQGSPPCSPCGRCHWDPPAPGPAAPAPPHSSGAHTCTGTGVTVTCSTFPSPESREGLKLSQKQPQPQGASDTYSLRKC